MALRLPAVPVWVGRERVLSGQAALGSGPVNALVLDDGFQHLALDRDLDIVLLHCRSPFGNGLVLPAGPLREPVAALARADAFVITHADFEAEAERLKSTLNARFPEKPVFACRHKISGFRLAGTDGTFPPQFLRGRKAVSFAGIARPEDFFRDLEAIGIKICGTFAFPDHHRYSLRDMLEIFAGASERGTEIVITTAKDSVRVPAEHREALAVTEMEIEFGADLDRFRTFLGSRL
jgi:tetraacyldisaccharide 4'-kinase